MTTPETGTGPVPSPDTIRKALRAVKDPELNLNIIDIGLVYDIEAGEQGDVKVKMTLTSPGCPAGGEIIEDVRKVAGDLKSAGDSATEADVRMKMDELLAQAREQVRSGS